MQRIQFRRFLLATSIVACGFGANAVHAQALAEPANAPAQAAPDMATDAQAAQASDIIVTGSRLTNSGFQAPTPVTVVGEAALAQRAPSTISDVVNELPAFRQTATNTQNQRGNGNGGQNRVDLRGLGAERTLVLVDGRRHVPTNLTGTLDVNIIPTALVDRVEVVTGGASAAYGSDAVSGVVNFILKDQLTGIVGSAQYGFSQRGDNLEPAISLATGADFSEGRGHIVVGADFSENHGVSTLYSRGWGRQQPCLLSFGSAAARGDLPAQGYANNCTYSQQSDGGVINSGPLKGIAFGAGGAPYNFNYGQVYSNLMFGGGTNPEPDANPFGNWNIRAPNRRINALVKLSYEFSDALTVYGQFGGADIVANGLSSYHQAPSIIVPITNPFIPTAVRDQMIANDLDSITVGRYETQLGGYKLRATNRIYRGVAGLKGKIGDSWSYDVFYQRGVTNGHQRVRTNIFEGNYLAATYVVNDANGNPVCGPLDTNPNLTAARRAQVLSGCVPFNIFGRESPSDAALNYIRYDSDNHTHYTQDVASANINGEPFSTWAGPVSFAAGYEYRRETGYSLADPYGQQVVALSNNGSTYDGKITVNEGYVEVGVPLAKDLPFAQSLDLNGAVRRTHYSTSGSVTTWKLGATWEPDDALRFRVTRSRDIRAANMTELFQKQAIGITASFLNPINNQTGPIHTISGGNPNLTPEIATNWTAGVVFQPSWEWLRGFRASIDYFDVKIKDVIATVAASDIARRCALGLQEYCDLITFDDSPSGIADIRTTPANLNQLNTNGLDIELAYRVPTEDMGIPGTLDIRSLTTWTAHLTTVDAASSIDRAGSGALGGVPKWNNNTTITYALGRVTNSLQFRYTSAIKGDATLVGPDSALYDPQFSNSINVNHFPAALYVNWTLQYDVLRDNGRSLQVFGIVNNLFDKDPADYAIIAFASGGNPYDVIGRTFKVGARFKF